MDVFRLLRRLFGTRDGAFPKQEQPEWTASDRFRAISGASTRESAEPALDEAVPG